MKTKQKIIGDSGEDKAANFLVEHGYSILARNWRTRYGEIDIIATICDKIVFVEVKTLPRGDIETLQVVLNNQKQKKIIETSKCFLINNRQYSKHYIRYDVIVVDMPNFPTVYHIENAFSEPV